MRMIALILGLVVLFLLVACGKGQTEESEPQTSEAVPELSVADESKIAIELDHPESISSDEEFSVKITMTNEFGFPVTLSSIRFPFSDFKFDGKGFVTNPDVNMQPQEAKVLEYSIKRNMEANLGSGLISSLIEFNLKIKDPEGVIDFSKREDFVLEFI